MLLLLQSTTGTPSVPTVAPLQYVEGTLGIGANYVDFAIWEGLDGTTTLTGEPWIVGGGLLDKSAQWYPTPAGTFLLEGSNDMTLTEWAPLTNPGGELLDENVTPALQQILVNPYAIRPRVGGATTGLTVVLFARRARHV